MKAIKLIAIAVAVAGLTQAVVSAQSFLNKEQREQLSNIQIKTARMAKIMNGEAPRMIR